MSNRNLDNLFKDIGAPWNVAWGYITGISIERRGVNQGNNDIGNFTFDAKAGRRYRITLNIPVGKGVNDGKTLVFCRINYDGNWLDEGESGANWENTSTKANNTIMAYIAMQTDVECRVNKTTEIFINISADTDDTAMGNSRISVEDVGPIVRS